MPKIEVDYDVWLWDSCIRQRAVLPFITEYLDPREWRFVRDDEIPCMKSQLWAQEAGLCD